MSARTSIGAPTARALVGRVAADPGITKTDRVFAQAALKRLSDGQ